MLQLNRTLIKFRIPQPLHMVARHFSLTSPPKKIYLHVPYSLKRAARLAGAAWDFVEGKWYCYEGTPELEKCRLWHREYLQFEGDAPQSPNVHPRKDARWDHTLQKWYVLGNSTYSPQEHTDPDVVEKTVAKIEPHHKVVIFDIETTGLPNFTLPIDDIERYESSRIVQVSYLLCNCIDLTPVGATNPMDVIGDVIVKSDGFPINNEEFHGITLSRSMKEGLPFKEAIAKLKPIFMEAQYILAHNAAFDISVLRSELKRYGEEEFLKHLDSMTVVCSMQKTTVLLKLIGAVAHVYKRPSLKELYSFATKEIITNQHNAIYDVINLQHALKCLFDQQQINVDEFFNAKSRSKDARIPKEAIPRSPGNPNYYQYKKLN